MTEWWQEGEEDKPVPVPRRDSIPESHFGDSVDAASAPELTTFIPEWRARRRVIAIVTTVVGFGLTILMVIDFFRVLSSNDPYEHALGASRFIGHTIEFAIAVAVVAWVWRWANQRDLRDQRKLRP